MINFAIVLHLEPRAPPVRSNEVPPSLPDLKAAMRESSVRNICGPILLLLKKGSVSSQFLFLFLYNMKWVAGQPHRSKLGNYHTYRVNGKSEKTLRITVWLSLAISRVQPGADRSPVTTTATAATACAQQDTPTSTDNRRQATVLVSMLLGLCSAFGLVFRTPSHG